MSPDIALLVVLFALVVGGILARPFLHGTWVAEFVEACGRKFSFGLEKWVGTTKEGLYEQRKGLVVKETAVDVALREQQEELRARPEKIDLAVLKVKSLLKVEEGSQQLGEARLTTAVVAEKANQADSEARVAEAKKRARAADAWEPPKPAAAAQSESKDAARSRGCPAER